MSAFDAPVPRLTNLTKARIVVYGHIDNAPVGATLKYQGILPEGGRCEVAIAADGPAIVAELLGTLVA